MGFPLPISGNICLTLIPVISRATVGVISRDIRVLDLVKRGGDPAEVEKGRQALLEYCGMDTLGMVRLYKTISCPNFRKLGNSRVPNS